MSEAWRNKTYYRPRVLISTNAVLSPQFGDSIVCITGAEQEMLRNLTQYLHRRSTFADSYGTDSYVTPSNAEWDSIQAIVADLEIKLMGCDDWTQLLTDILEQVTCCCEKPACRVAISPALTPIVDDYVDSGAMQPSDDYGGDTVVDAKRCAIAQLTFWQAWEFLTEVVQPTQDALSDILMPLAMTLLASMIGTPILGIPVGLFLGMVWSLIEVWESGSLQSVQNAYWSSKDELICAVWAGLAFDYRTAETRAVEVIADIDGLSPIDRVLLHTMFAPWAIALAEKAYENGTSWALANVSSGACDDCDWVYERVYEFPPCPSNWTGGFSCYQNRYPGLNGDEFAYSLDFTIPDIASNIDIEVECKYVSYFGPGWTVGYAVVEYQDAGMAWNPLCGLTATTLKTAFAINTDGNLCEDASLDRNVLRVNLHGQPGQHTSDPWPFMPLYVRVRIVPHI